MSEEAATDVREATSSIEVQRAKDGTYYWTIKFYFDGSDLNGHSDALWRIERVDEALRKTYLGAGDTDGD